MKITKHAFTLVELILVVVILSIITALAVPRFSQTYGTMQLKTSASDMAQLMRYAQSRSVTSQEIIRLNINQQERVYWLTKREVVSGDSSLEFERIHGRLGRRFAIPVNIDIEIEKNSIDFLPDGSIDKIRLILCQKNNCRTISTMEQRGFIHVFEERLNTL